MTPLRLVVWMAVWATLSGCAVPGRDSAGGSPAEESWLRARAEKLGKLRIRDTAGPFRVSARSTWGSDPFDWWLYAGSVGSLDADPSPAQSGVLSVISNSGSVSVTSGAGAHGRRLFVDCDLTPTDVDAGVRWEAQMSSAPPGYAGGKATLDPATGRYYFVTPLADGTIATPRFTITAPPLGPPPGEWSFRFCDVLPFSE